MWVAHISKPAQVFEMFTAQGCLFHQVGGDELPLFCLSTDLFCALNHRFVQGAICHEKGPRSLQVLWQSLHHPDMNASVTLETKPLRHGLTLHGGQ